MIPIEVAAKITHHADLIERHAVQVDVPDPLPSGDLLVRLRQTVWAACTDIAQKWADDEDLVIEVEPFERQDKGGRPATWGVRFTVVVGRGTEPLTKLDEPEHPGWTWSDRWRSWLSCFRLMDRPELRAIDGGRVVSIDARR